VTAVTTDDVKKLSGGGDWHTNYIQFYQRIDDLEGKVWEEDTVTPAANASESSSSSSSSSTSA